MKFIIKRAATAVTALMMAASVVSAQNLSTSLPLTSVGDGLMWSVGDQTMYLDVPVQGRVKLELYSPRFDPNDYRSSGYYGDEEYTGGKSIPRTTFSIIREDGSVVLSRIFKPGKHAWETLIDQELPAGKYLLRADTKGNGKNTFAIRLSGLSAGVGADRLSVNVHAEDWIPAVRVQKDDQSHALRMYDGDGPSELEARIRDEAGNIYPAMVSGDVEWLDIPLPPQSGLYTLELRQPKKTKQYSNTVSFELTRNGRSTPITISKVDLTGQLQITAELVLPMETRPTGVKTLINGQFQKVEGQLQKEVKAGEYTLSVFDVAGAQVSLDQPRVNVPEGGLGQAKIQVRPQVDLVLNSDKKEVCLGDVVTLSARTITGYSGDLPMQLRLDVPGFEIQGEAKVTGQMSATQPGEILVKAKAMAAGQTRATAHLDPWKKRQSLELMVKGDATNLQISRIPVQNAQVGDTVEVKLILKNTATVPTSYQVIDSPSPQLQTLSTTSFKGVLAAGEEKALMYKAKVRSAGQGELKATLVSPSCGESQISRANLITQAVPKPKPPPKPAAPAPVIRRQSTVNLSFEVPQQTQAMTVAHALPAKTAYIPGSARLNGQSIEDPLKGKEDMLYWIFPTVKPTKNDQHQRGTLTYQVRHAAALGQLAEPALSVDFSGNRTEALVGQIDPEDLKNARPIGQESKPVIKQNQGAIKLPIDDTLIRVRNLISVTVEAPLGPVPPLQVNGQAVPEALLGAMTQDKQRKIQRLTFVGVPIQPGPNKISFLKDNVTVRLVGPTDQVEVTPEKTLADGSTPVRIKLRALDAFGELTNQPELTLRTNLEPHIPDSNPSETGYQIRLTDGVGYVELQPQAGPADLKLEVQVKDKLEPHLIPITPDKSRVGVGMISATVGVSGDFSLENNVLFQAKGYYEGPLADGKLYVAADKDGLPTDQNTLARYSVYGDASSESVPLQGIDPVAVSYDHPAFRAEYRRTQVPVEVLPVGENLTALTVFGKSNPNLSGFVAFVPQERVSNEELIPQNNRLLRLSKDNILLGSETLVLVTRERKTGRELERITWKHNVDYVLDPETGIITLAKPLDRYDDQLNELVVLASYRMNEPMANRQLAFGVQGQYQTPDYQIGAAVVNLDDKMTMGGRFKYTGDTSQLSGLVAYSNGLQASAEFSTELVKDHTFGVRASYRQQTYEGLAPANLGFFVSGHYQGKFNEHWAIQANAHYSDVPAALNAVKETESTQNGSVSMQVKYKALPFSVGTGVQYSFGENNGLSALISAGYSRDSMELGIVHNQSLTGNVKTTTDLSAKFKVRRNLTLGITDKITWGEGQQAAITLDSTVGNVNYAIGYELPTAGGEGNRARASVETNVPISKTTSAGLRGNALYDIAKEQIDLGAGADVNYKTERVSATVGTDLTYQQKQFGVVLKSSITGSLTDQLTLSGDGLVEYASATDQLDGRLGSRLGVGYAYRAREWASLGYLRYINGTLAGNKPEFSSGASAEYHQSQWRLSTGFDTRTLLKDSQSLTYQAYLGGNYYINDRFGVGAWARMYNQPALDHFKAGYGIEGSMRVLPSTWFTAGYNLQGFDGLPSAGTYTRPGLYIRLDMVFDETLGEDKE